MRSPFAAFGLLKSGHHRPARDGRDPYPGRAFHAAEACIAGLDPLARIVEQLMPVVGADGDACIGFTCVDAAESSGRPSVLMETVQWLHMIPDGRDAVNPSGIFTNDGRHAARTRRVSSPRRKARGVRAPARRVIRTLCLKNGENEFDRRGRFHVKYPASHWKA
jgi:hypothetical protein